VLTTPNFVVHKQNDWYLILSIATHLDLPLWFSKVHISKFNIDTSISTNSSLQE
jgi:hypothetical protein